MTSKALTTKNTGYVFRIVNITNFVYFSLFSRNPSLRALCSCTGQSALNKRVCDVPFSRTSGLIHWCPNQVFDQVWSRIIQFFVFS